VPRHATELLNKRVPLSCSVASRHYSAPNELATACSEFAQHRSSRAMLLPTCGTLPTAALFSTDLESSPVTVRRTQSSKLALVCIVWVSR